MLLVPKRRNMADPAPDLYSFRRDDLAAFGLPKAFPWSCHPHEPPYPKTSAQTQCRRSPEGRAALSGLAGRAVVWRIGPAASRPSVCGPGASRAEACAWQRPSKDTETAPLPTKVQTVVVTADENNMRVDRFLEARFPGLSFSHIQRIVRKGELRVNGKRADSKDRLEEGQSVRIPPLKLDTPRATAHLSEAGAKTLAALKEMTFTRMTT